MLLREFDLNNYLFGIEKKELLPVKSRKLFKNSKEMAEIFYGRNMPSMKNKSAAKQLPMWELFIIDIPLLLILLHKEDFYIFQHNLSVAYNDASDFKSYVIHL